MRMISGRRPRLRKLAVIAGAGLCLGTMPAFGVAGSASAKATAKAAGGTVDRWGRGQLRPAAAHLPAPVAEVGTSNAADYALLTNGTLWAWGYNSHGELGNGTTSKHDFTPVQVEFPAGVSIASIPANSDPWNTAYAIDTNGNVWGWGANAGGELCLNNEQQYLTPVEITSLSDVTAVAGASQHTTYDAGGTLYSCGVNTVGQLGDGSTQASRVPVPVQGLSGASVTALVSGYNNVGALLANGQYYDWGWNAGGQLGDGTVGGESDVPVQVTLPRPATQAAQGGNGPKDGHTLVMLSDGSIYAWGVNSSGQLGTGNLKPHPSPFKIQPPAGVAYETLAAGGATSYAVSTTGEVYSWGANDHGQLGDGSTTSSKTPVQILSNATQLISSTSTEAAVAVQG